VWIPLILASALLLAFYDVTRKHSVRENAVMPVLFLSVLAGLFFLVALLAATGELRPALTLTPHQHLLVFLKALATAAMWTCVFYAMRALPITIVSPIRNSAPFWTLLGGILLYGEVPGWGRAGGMALVLAGYVLFTFAGRAEGIRFSRHYGIGLVAIGTLLGAVTALYDKYLLQKQQLPPNTVQFWFAVWLVPLVAGMLLAQRRGQWARTAFTWRWSVPVVGILLVLSDWCYFHALACPDVAISVLSLVRRSSMVLTFAVGAVLFGEGNLRRKTTAMAFILAGVAMLCLAR
jgi:drug/metabolite transporter (DMT)-like permease